jgi:hypothetical protein
VELEGSFSLLQEGKNAPLKGAKIATNGGIECQVHKTIAVCGSEVWLYLGRISIRRIDRYQLQLPPVPVG